MDTLHYFLRNLYSLHRFKRDLRSNVNYIIILAKFLNLTLPLILKQSFIGKVLLLSLNRFKFSMLSVIYSTLSIAQSYNRCEDMTKSGGERVHIGGYFLV